MKIVRWLAVVALLGQGGAASAQEPGADQGPGARIWMDRGDDPLLQRGDRVRVYYRTEADAFVAIFHVDTDGALTLLHPRAPDEDSFTRGGRDYRLLFPQSSYWYVDEYPGKGYFFLVSSPHPLALDGLDYVYQDRRWDLTRVGQTVYRDPYLAMDDYVALLLPDWESTPYGLDFLTYDVGEVHEYPRFLCYDCHGYRSYATWNPYTYACASFRVVIWDDPWFHPGLRYPAARVAYAAPRRGVARFGFKERAAGEAWTPLNRSREAQPRRSVEYVEPGAARPDASPAARPRRPTSLVEPGAVAHPTEAPLRQATPSAGSKRRDEPPAEVTPPTSGERPVLQRRPSGSAPSRPSSGATARPTGGDRGPGVSRPSGGSTRAVTPPRSGGGSAKPAPSVRPPSPSRAPSASRPSTGSRPSGGSSGRASPPSRRRGG